MNHIATPDLDHNQGPATEAEALHLRLTEDHADIIKRVDDLTAAAGRVPAAIDSDELCGKASDFIKQIRAAAKAAADKRTEAKAPYLDAGRTVDAFFKRLSEALDKARKPVEQRVNEFLIAKEQEERRRREEEARKAEEARRQAEAETRAAEEEARRQVEAMTSDEDMTSAIAAEEAARAAADAQAARQRAEDEARKEAEAKAADLARTRGDYGGVATLTSRWDFKGLDRSTLDLEALRQHLPQAALEQGVRAFIRAGGRELRGAVIYQNKSTTIR